MEQQSKVLTSRADASDYEPFMTEHGQEGEVHWIRTSGGDGVPLKVGLWRALPGSLPERLPVTFAGAETLFVLEGRLDVEVVDGEVISLAPNDVATFEKGTETVWQVHAPFKALMVISGSDDHTDDDRSGEDELGDQQLEDAEVALREQSQGH